MSSNELKKLFNTLRLKELIEALRKNRASKISYQADTHQRYYARSDSLSMKKSCLNLKPQGISHRNINFSIVPIPTAGQTKPTRVIPHCPADIIFFKDRSNIMQPSNSI